MPGRRDPTAVAAAVVDRVAEGGGSGGSAVVPGQPVVVEGQQGQQDEPGVEVVGSLPEVASSEQAIQSQQVPVPKPQSVSFMTAVPSATKTASQSLLPDEVAGNIHREWQAYILDRDVKVDITKLVWDLHCTEGQIRPLGAKKVSRY